MGNTLLHLFSCNEHDGQPQVVGPFQDAEVHEPTGDVPRESLSQEGTQTLNRDGKQKWKDQVRGTGHQGGNPSEGGFWESSGGRGGRRPVEIWAGGAFQRDAGEGAKLGGSRTVRDSGVAGAGEERDTVTGVAHELMRPEHIDAGNFHADGPGATREPWGVTASAPCPAHGSSGLLPNHPKPEPQGRGPEPGPGPGTRDQVQGGGTPEPWACPPRPGSLPVSSWAHSQVPEKLTCSPMSRGWFPTGTRVMPGRSMRVRSGTSGEVMSTLMSSWLMSTPFPAKVFWAAEAEAGGKPRVQMNNPSKEMPRAPGA